MRGGTSREELIEVVNWGLSPHALGNLCRIKAAAYPLGSIPACAGEPVCCILASQLTRVYPRMRGGTVRVRFLGLRLWGLSPHARGNLIRNGCRAFNHGSIPACAGEPLYSRSYSVALWVYPRMRGGTWQTVGDGVRVTGLSPHARGNL